MMKFCPGCSTERQVSEMFCEHDAGGGPCGFPLADVLMKPEGWRPGKVITQPPPPAPVRPLCPNGHAVDVGDMLCTECGAEVQLGPPVSEGPPQGTETVVAGWAVVRALESPGSTEDRYLVEQVGGERRAVLTLYRHGVEPDPSVYDALARVSREHVREIYATGRWDDRAFEITEELNGGVLADLGTVINDLDGLRRVVYELGKALSSLAEVGVRHRDIRPETLLVRNRDPLDLVIGGFGSARLSEFDLDIVAPLEVTRYMAPEAVAGGVAPASDWWSLGVVLLEQYTRGACFDGISDKAFLIHVLANDVPMPSLAPEVEPLFRGLLTRDRHQRWKWAEVQAWLAGETVAVAQPTADGAGRASGPAISLGGRQWSSAASYAFAAAEDRNWNEAREQLVRGVVTTWAEDARLSAPVVAGLRRVTKHDGLSDDFKLLLALKVLNSEMPAILGGAIVTPKWLLENPQQGYELISGPVPDLLCEFEAENWLGKLKVRISAVRTRAQMLGITLSENELRIYLLSTSRAKLSAEWEARRKFFPDSEHPGVLSLLERRSLNEEDMIVVLSATMDQLRAANAIVTRASELARTYDVASFNPDVAQDVLGWSRPEIFSAVSERIEGFATCGRPDIDSWADKFRVEKRLPLANCLVLLAIPKGEWTEPQKQQYIAQILDFFEKKVVTSILRGPLVKMTIGKTTPRVDLSELQTSRFDAAALLDHVLNRNGRAVTLDPAALSSTESTTGPRLQSLERHAHMYKRDTGIDGTYLGFPFLLAKDARASTTTRIAPVLLWPVKVRHEVGARGNASIAFDDDREEVRLNPALEALVGAEAMKLWRAACDELLGRSGPKAADVVDAFGTLATPKSRSLKPLPGSRYQLPPRSLELECSAVLFHVTFMGQAIGEDIRSLKEQSPLNSGLETALRLADKKRDDEAVRVLKEADRYFTVASDPSQESAVLNARTWPGLVVEGPPGTGKSQTIVNMVCDAIGHHRSLLLVCQKHAALEVVHKRLVAEGLGGRLVMVNDVNSDRVPIIRSVREQLEQLARRSDDPAAQAKRSRIATASRIEALEAALNRHHAAVHEVDERLGISYRTLLGELITLEADSPPLDVPALRQLLTPVSLNQLVAIEEEVAPLVRYWLPAKYEDSPLSDVLPFNPDPATVLDFAESFRVFVQCETTRAEVLNTRQAEFEVDDPNPHRAWLAAYGTELLDLADSERTLLARWLPNFRQMSDSETSGQALTAAARALDDELATCRDEDSDAALSPILALLPLERLAALLAMAREAAAPPSFLQRLNPFRALRKRQVLRFLTDSGASSASQRVNDLCKAAALEERWRPLRKRLGNLHETLHLPDIAADAGTVLRTCSSSTLNSLLKAGNYAEHLAMAPDAGRIDAIAAKGTKSAVLRLFAEFDAAFARYEARQGSFKALEPMKSWMQPGWVTSFGERIAQNQPNTAQLRPLEAALPTLVAYQNYRPRAQLLSPEATRVLSILRKKEDVLAEVPKVGLEEEVRRIINREARLGWKQALEQNKPDLALDRDELTAKVESLANFDESFRKLNRDILRFDIDVGRIASLRAWEDITRLTGQRARRLREFIDMGAKLGLMELRPIWLMNPDVASRVLPLKSGLFDTVIYDEASQMPVEFAIPTLYRARVTVVSGDEKQMPPTAFFSSRVENDEADSPVEDMMTEDATEEEREVFEETWNRREIKDCPDLLQLAKTCLPPTQLQVHYRSAYRELINYSNAAFYGNNLNVPVRHPEATVLEAKPIELIQVDGVYHDQTNQAEADKVVELLARMWAEPFGQRPSVGVVTFNRKQADLIGEALENRCQTDAAFREAFRLESERTEEGEDMGIFVKNVENVQGDERDVIIFSSTFGRNRQGSFFRRFGVLGQKGGERRLNVAVTRARQKVVMVTSMPINDISDMLSTKRAPATPRDYLQGYMEYARAVSAGELSGACALLARLGAASKAAATESISGVDDGFLAAVMGFLTSLGHVVRRTEDTDAFGVDFALENPGTGLFAIGIECDAPRHELLRSARAREVWRPTVLMRAIPVIHRVSSQGWYHDGENERRGLLNAVKKAMGEEVSA